MEVHIVQKKNEAIPTCITNLKALKALNIINFEQHNPIILESFNSFIECLKKFSIFFLEDFLIPGLKDINLLS